MLSPSVVRTLAPRFKGALLTPSDPGYDTARTVFNAAIDRRPAVIAKCTTSDDVVQAVKLASEHQLLLSVRGAGHNVAGFAVCDDGIVIDLSPMKDVAVDPARRTVRAGAGLNWGEVNDALQPHGLAAAGGFVSVTGIAGLTLGGGVGWLVRKHGLALDNLLSAQVVLADGRVVTASPTENAELFWAIRGGGGNFGVVTSFEFQAHPAGTVLAGMVVHPLSNGEGALRHWRDLEKTAPEESNQGALIFSFPDDPALPPPLRGASVVGLGGVYAGAVDEGERVLRPLRAYGPPAADMFAPMPYNMAQRMADSLWPSGLRNYWKSSYLRELNDAALDVMLDFFRRVPSPHTVVVLEHNGDGALERVPEDATAFGYRRWPYNFLVTSAWRDPADTERNTRWTREFFDAMRPFLASGAYVNYLGDEGAAGPRAAYGADKYARLAALKMKYDPSNLFRMNQNILPAAAAGAGRV
jgi:FAD/FMN-containing dehydrogenase